MPPLIISFAAVTPPLLPGCQQRQRRRFRSAFIHVTLFLDAAIFMPLL